MHCNLENFTFDPFMYVMGTPMLIVPSMAVSPNMEWLL